jgi:hypothetical protein
MASNTPTAPLQMSSPPQYTATASGITSFAPTNAPTEPDLTHGPKVRFYHQLRINWKFGMTNYLLVEHPASDFDPPIFKFAKTLEPRTEVLHNLIFGVTQGLSKNVYKLYYTTLVFKDMSHKEAVDTCARHVELTRFARILSNP